MQRTRWSVFVHMCWTVRKPVFAYVAFPISFVHFNLHSAQVSQQATLDHFWQLTEGDWRETYLVAEPRN